MSKLKIKKVELHKSGKKVKLTIAQSVVSKSGETVEKDIVETIHKEPNDDLVTAFMRLVPHYMFVSELVPVMADVSFIEGFQFQDDARFNGVNVVSIELAGKELDQVVMVGSKSTSKKAVFGWPAPRIWLDDQSDAAYPLLNSFIEHKNEVFKEAEEFYNGKYKASNQAELQF